MRTVLTGLFWFGLVLVSFIFLWEFIQPCSGSSKQKCNQDLPVLLHLVAFGKNCRISVAGGREVTWWRGGGHELLGATPSLFQTALKRLRPAGCAPQPQPAGGARGSPAQAWFGKRGRCLGREKWRSHMAGAEEPRGRRRCWGHSWGALSQRGAPCQGKGGDISEDECSPRENTLGQSLA